MASGPTTRRASSTFCSGSNQASSQTRRLTAPGLHTPRVLGPNSIHTFVYASSKLRIDGLDRFPEMRDRIDNFDRLDEEKATAFLAEHWRSGLVAECPVKAIFIPEVAGGARTAVVPTPWKEAWRAMTSWTLKQLTGCGRDSIALLTRFAASLPAFRLVLGRDRHEVRAALEEALARL